MRYYRLPPTPSRFSRYYDSYQRKPRASKIGYVVFLILGIFLGKSGYDWTQIQSALKIDSDLRLKMEQSLKDGQYDRVIQYSQESLQLKLQTWWKDYGSLERVYFNLGMAYKAKGEVDKAIESLQKALALAQKKYGQSADFTQQIEKLLQSFLELKIF